MIATAAQVGPKEFLAAVFDGTNDRISITPNDPLNLSLQDFTLYIDAYKEPNTSGATENFVEQGIGGTILYYGTNRRWRAGMGNTLAGYTESDTNKLINPPQYTSPGFSFNFATKEVILYVDGVESSRKVVTVSSAANNTSTINIGARTGTTKAAYKGKARRFRLHLGVILTPEEMNHAARGGDIQRGLFIDYDLNSPTLVDKKGNSTAAAFDGTTWVRDVITL
jgi:hypothetical protein